MKYRIFLTLMPVVICAQLASADPQTERIRKLVAETSSALTSGNYGRIVQLTYPKVVEMSGGREKMIENLRLGSEALKANGIAILGRDVSEPNEVVTVGEKQFTIVPTTTRVQVPNGVLRSKSFVIAVSEDRGKTWTFVDGSELTKEPGKEKEKLAQILPDFPPQLSLPSPEPPQLEPK